MNSYPTVVIVGKPNVGKSQLFNRLVGERHSIVHDSPGITRDRLMLPINWYGKICNLIDTGGYTEDELIFQEQINQQTEIALKESNLVIFLVSCKEGINEEDLYVSKMLKKKKIQNILLAANKCDCEVHDDFPANKLGFGEPIFISAEHGINTGQLLDQIFSRIDSQNLSFKKNDAPSLKVAIIGRPNVGKSSLVNVLLKKNRIISSNIAGTTRDAVDVDFSFGGERYTLIDTPGIKRHASINGEEKEKFSILRTHKAISRSNMVWFMLDVFDGLCELDERIGGLIYKSNIPAVIIVNKCDLIDGFTDEFKRKFEAQIRKKFKYLSWAPCVFVSVKNREFLHGIFKKVKSIQKDISNKVEDRLLKEFVYKISFLYSVPSVKGKKIKLFDLLKKEGQVPTFLFLCNNPEYLHFSYARMIERQIRICFGYKNCPITVIYKKK